MYGFHIIVKDFFRLYVKQSLHDHFLFLTISLGFVCLFTGCRGDHQQTKQHINNLFTKESLKPEHRPRQYLSVWSLQAGTLKSIALSSKHDCSTTSNRNSPVGRFKEIPILQVCEFIACLIVWINEWKIIQLAKKTMKPLRVSLLIMKLIFGTLIKVN